MSAGKGHTERKWYHISGYFIPDKKSNEQIEGQFLSDKKTVQYQNQPYSTNSPKLLERLIEKHNFSGIDIKDRKGFEERLLLGFAYHFQTRGILHKFLFYNLGLVGRAKWSLDEVAQKIVDLGLAKDVNGAIPLAKEAVSLSYDSCRGSFIFAEKPNLKNGTIEYQLTQTKSCFSWYDISKDGEFVFVPSD